MVDATEVIEQSEQEKQEVYSYVDDVAEYFIERDGELFEVDEAVQDVSDEFGVSQRVASQILRELYSDIVDPVIRVPRSGTSYVGVVEYVERDGWYGYIHYDDIDGKVRRGVCAKDVLEGVKDSEVGYADRDPSVGWDEIDEVFEEYYNDAYPDVDRTEVNVEVGASLLSGTTVGGNTVSIDGHDHTGESINPQSVSTESLSNGVAGDGNTITSITDNEGEYRRVASLPFLPGESTTITDTDYTPMSGGDGWFVYDFGSIGVNTNIEETIYVSISGRNEGDDSGAVRALDSPDTEVSFGAGATTFAGDIGEWDRTQDGDDNLYIEAKRDDSDGSEIEMLRMMMHVYERVA